MAEGRRRVFPLVPRRRFSGVAFGDRHSRRRGFGDEVAGSRPYRPGDHIAWIDWKASARLSAARGGDEFVVREYFADEAPRVAVVCDRRPAMGLYGPAFPWLDKGEAVAAVAELVGASALASRGELAYLDTAGPDGRPFWLPPGSRRRLREVERRTREAGFAAPANALQRALEALLRHAGVLPTDSFVFVVSDFLTPVTTSTWGRLRSARWDVVPVVVQDPVWEQSFPAAGGVVLPLTDPETGRTALVRLSPREARERERANEERLRTLLSRFRRLGFDPVLVGTSDRAGIASRFLAWAEHRQALRRSRP